MEVELIVCVIFVYWPVSSLRFSVTRNYQSRIATAHIQVRSLGALQYTLRSKYGVYGIEAESIFNSAIIYCIRSVCGHVVSAAGGATWGRPYTTRVVAAASSRVYTRPDTRSTDSCTRGQGFDSVHIVHGVVHGYIFPDPVQFINGRC